MARLFLMIVMIVAIQSTFAGTEFKSQDEFGHWLTYYYANPEPNRIPDAIKFMSQVGTLDNNNAISPIFGFLSGVFRDNPEKINAWLKDLRNLKEKHLRVVVLGLWYSGLPDSKSRVIALLNKNPSLMPDFNFINQGLPMTIEKIPLEQGPWVLDALWGKFMATGERAPVERIITTLPWFEIKGDTNRLLIGGSARWSLASNAIQHKRVLKICEDVLIIQKGDDASKLQELIANAKKELKSKNDPVENKNVTQSKSAFWRDPDGNPVQETESMKSKNDFAGSLLAVTDEDWKKKWDTSPETKPSFNKAGVVPYGKKIFILTFFSNPSMDKHKKSNVRCDLKIISPTGKVSMSQQDLVCFAGQITGSPYLLYLSAPVITFSGDPGDPAGTWVVEVNLRDAIRNVELPLRTTFELK